MCSRIALRREYGPQNNVGLIRRSDTPHCFAACRIDISILASGISCMMHGLSFLRQHRTIWQEHSAKDFASYESYKRAGILYVFPPFITARMGQKIGRRPQTQLCGDAIAYFMKLVGWEQLATQGVPRWQVHKRVAGGSQRRGSIASPV